MSIYDVSVIDTVNQSATRYLRLVCKPIASAFTHSACRLSGRKNQTCLIHAIGVTTGLQTVKLSEFDRLHMTIGMQTGMQTRFAYRFANRSSCVNALLQ